MRKTTLILLAAGLMVALSAGESHAAVDEPEAFRILFPHLDLETGFSNDWGDVRSQGRRHKGTDLLAEKGSPVVAIADGVVYKIAVGKPRAGIYLVIRHGDDWESWYMHLNNDTPGTDDGRGGAENAFPEGIAEGAPVVAGQVIAFVGDSGNAEHTTAHTHFELHYRGRPINPYHFLVRAEARRDLERAILAGELPFR